MASSTTAADDHDAISARNALTSPLLRLPAELRNKVYIYVATEGNYRLPSPQPPAVQYRNPTSKPEPEYSQRAQWLGLLRTCRQTHHEANLLPYTSNSFSPSPSARDFADFDTWFALIKTSNKPIETLHLQVDTSQAFRWIDEVQPPSNLAQTVPSVKKVVVYCVESKKRPRSSLWAIHVVLTTVEHRMLFVKSVVRKWLRVEERGLDVEFVQVDEEDISRGNGRPGGRNRLVLKMDAELPYTGPVTEEWEDGGVVVDAVI